MTDYDKMVGRNIRNQRKYRNISSAELAQMLDVSLSSIGHIERGNRSVSISNLIKLAEIFNMGVEHFFYGTRGRVIISEEKPEDPIKERKNTLNTLLFGMEPHEIDFVISIVRNLKALKKDNTLNESEEAEETEGVGY